MSPEKVKVINVTGVDAKKWNNKKWITVKKWLKVQIQVIIISEYINLPNTIPHLFTLAYTGQDIQLVAEHHNLWLPNCSVIPSHPSICSQELVLLDYFRYGFLGHFNPGFYPQVLSNKNPHYTFFLEAPHFLYALAIVENCPKWACLNAIWMPDICNIGTGHVHGWLLNGLRAVHTNQVSLFGSMSALSQLAHYSLDKQRLLSLTGQWGCQML